jgi:hypothetical protein
LLFVEKLVDGEILYVNGDDYTIPEALLARLNSSPSGIEEAVDFAYRFPGLTSKTR